MIISYNWYSDNLFRVYNCHYVAHLRHLVILIDFWILENREKNIISFATYPVQTHKQFIGNSGGGGVHVHA